MVAAFAERREVIVAGAEPAAGVRCAKPGGAFYTFPNVSGTGYDARTLQTELLDEAGVATIAGTSFGAFGEDYMRLSYANSLDGDRRGDRAHPQACSAICPGAIEAEPTA